MNRQSLKTGMSRRRGQPGGNRSGLTELGSSAVSAVAVIALVAVLLLMFGRRADHLEAVDRVAATDMPTAPASVPSEPPLPVAPAPGLGDDADAVPGPIIGPQAKAAATVTPSPAAGPAAPGVVTDTTSVSVPYTGPKVPIVLFNQTVDPNRMSALQHALVAAGWTVDATDTWHGKVPETTVYYPVGMLKQAKALMAEFPTIARLRPAFTGIPMAGKLTVIICDDRTPTATSPD
jgi:hypothetical protein